VTFDDLPQCPRCKESFALVRPLASASLDGARHVLRDDPELRLKLRDRLHRARLDRRMENENPMAAGPDPDAPDWFEPEPGGDNGAAEAMLAAAPAAGERSKENGIVHTDDLSPDDNARGGATTADADTAAEAEIIEASREFDDTEAPEFQGDIPGFTDWREELRERLKRIRARREQERLAGGDADEDTVAAATDAPGEEAQPIAEADPAPEEDEEVVTELETAPDEDDEPTAELETAPEEVEEAVAELETAPEDDEEAVAQDETAAEEDEEAVAEDEIAAEEDEEAVAEDETAAEEGEEAVAEDDGASEQDEEPEDGAAAEEDAIEELVIEEPAAEVVGFAAAMHTSPAEEPEGSEESEAQTVAPPDLPITGAPATAGDIIAQIVDGPAADIDFTLDTEIPVADPDLVLSEAPDDDSPNPLILGERKAEASVPDADGLDDLIAEEAPPVPDEDAAAESVTEPLDAFEWGEATEEGPLAPETISAPDLATGDEESEAIPADGELPAAVMPDLPAVDAAPELDFDDAAAAVAEPTPEIDLPPAGETEDHALEWDREEVVAGPAAGSSAGPLGERAAAAVCDMLFLTAIGASLVGAASSGTGLPFRQVLVDEALWLGLAWSIFAIGYSVFLIGSCGQTIGRMIMHLRVVGDDQFSVGFDRAAIRLAAWVPSALPLLAGLLPALRDPKRRALHDRLSHTRVVKA
jgi:uncharacterized RDD family membrane protein YckC